MNHQAPLVIAAAVVLASVGWCLSDLEPSPAMQQSEIRASWRGQLEAVRQGSSTSIVMPTVRITTDLLAELESIAPRITELNLSGDHLAGRMDAIVACSNLRILHLRSPLGDDDLTALSQLPRLEVLDLPAADFTDVGLRALEGHPSLRLLRLRSPRLTDRGVTSLSHLPALRWVHLIEVPVTDAGLEVFRAMPELQSLYLDGDRATDRGLAGLVVSRPDLHFHRDQVHLPSDPRQQDGHPD